MNLILRFMNSFLIIKYHWNKLNIPVINPDKQYIYAFYNILNGYGAKWGPFSHLVSFFFIIILSGVRLSPFGTVYQPQMIDDGDCGATGGMKIGRWNRSTRRNPSLVPLCPPQIPHYQTRAGTRAAAVGSQRLTVWAMARPSLPSPSPVSIVGTIHLLHCQPSITIIVPCSPNLGLGLPPWNSPFHFGLLDLRHLVGLLWRVISSSQGLYLHTNTKTRPHTNTKHPCPEWDSNSWCRLPSERRQCIPRPLGYRDRIVPCIEQRKSLGSYISFSRQSGQFALMIFGTVFQLLINYTT
jgi:hypothetical protein